MKDLKSYNDEVQYINELPQEEKERLYKELDIAYRLNNIFDEIDINFIDSCQSIGQNILSTHKNEFKGKTTQISLLDSFFYRTHVIENEANSSLYLSELISLANILIEKLNYSDGYAENLEVIVLYSNILELRQFNQLLIFPENKRDKLLKKYNVSSIEKVNQNNNRRFASKWGNNCKNDIEVWCSDIDFSKKRENRIQDEIYFDKKANRVFSLGQFVKIGNKIEDAMKLSKKEYNKKYNIKIK